MDHQGVPASELTDTELARQGTHAHATRNWVFLHGTAEQFRHHTERMLELEQEYLRRYPKRTWQGSGGGGGIDLAEVDVLEQVRQLTRAYATAVDALLSRHPGKPTTDAAGTAAMASGERAEVELLRRYVGAPEGRLHKLEAHQAARAIGLSPAAVAALYKADPPLLVTAGEYRQITSAGRARATTDPR
jgi:hypothetical protein